MAERVVIVGGGFGGLYAAQKLGGASSLEVTLVDRRNFHLFQPLLYQVATGGLSPGDIASPLRSVLKKYRNISVLQAEVVGLHAAERRLELTDGALQYDTLIIAAGSQPYYFGRDEWAEQAPGLKSIEDALEMRRRILSAFERAERTTDECERRALMRFVVIGGGPTGVELAGTLAELAHNSLKGEFRHFDPSAVEVLLLEGGDRLLPPYPSSLSDRARRGLEKLGAEVQTGSRVKEIEEGRVVYERDGREEVTESYTVLWGAGMQASPLGKIIAESTGVELDRGGRVVVESDLSVAGHREILVLGDLAHFAHQGEGPLPGIAPVAMQQGRYAARLLKARLKGKDPGAFRYLDKGNLAVIGRHAAVADMGFIRMWGFPAWLIWLFVHIAYLIEFDNKVMVLFQWAWNYFTRKRGARLITGRDA